MTNPQNKMRPVAIIIQARMGSTRLPGKALADIAGQPALGHVFARTQQSRKADLIILATTQKKEDRVLIQLAKKYGVKTFAGSENDVLDRYYQAAKKFKARTVVRITGDCPLIDPGVIDLSIKKILNGQGKIDFVTFDYSYPDGLDIDTFSFTALKKTWQEAKLSSEREHIAPYLYKNPHLFKIDTIGPCFKNLNHLRWTLDEPKDLELIRKIHELAQSKKWRHLHLKNILKLYDRHPELLKINQTLMRNNDFPKSLEKEKIKFIAEVSSNHNRDLDRCLKFVDTAAAIGCWGIKFQLFKIEELFAPEILAKSARHRARRQWELPVKFLPAIAQRCQEKNIKFICTPFYLKAVEELKPYVDFYKIASYELPWLDLHRTCARTGKPVIFSTGIATLDEIQAGVNTLVKNGCKNITILHCTSSYPTPVKECNLAAIDTMRAQIKAPRKVQLSFGWSDHSVSPAVVYRAVKKWKAETVEFHLDLEGKGAESRTGHCWLPEKIQPVISGLVKSMARAESYGSQADGNGVKEPVPSELSERPWRADPSDGLRPFKEIRQTWQPAK